MTDTQQPSVAALGLSKAQYIELCDTLRDRAHQAHDNARAWASRALIAETRLAIYEGDTPPRDITPRATVPELTDAAGNPEPELPTTPAESE